MALTLWEELKPGYVYFWRRLTAFRHEDVEDREDTIVLGVFLVTFLPWLPVIWLVHLLRKGWRLMGG